MHRHKFLRHAAAVLVAAALLAAVVLAGLAAALPEKKNLSKQVELYPPTRFMGSKQKLLTELWNVASRFNFNSVVDLFSG